MQPPPQQIEATEVRYKDRANARKIRQELITSEDGDWTVVDQPARVAKRMMDLGLTEELSYVLPPDGAVSAPVSPAEVFERIIGESELIGIEYLLRGAQKTRSVGRIVVGGRNGAVRGFGTGFLVSPRVLMTNNHVLSTLEEAAVSTVQFDFFELRGGATIPVDEYALVPELLFVTDERLDFTVVAVAATSEIGTPLSSRPWSPLSGDSGKALIGERVNIVQHPAGRPQEASLRVNTIVDVFDDFCHYEADTQQGSSGSPAFNDQWEVAALHHSGVPERNAANQIMLTTGIPWDGSDATAPLINWVANEGIRISSIVAHLRQREVTAQHSELMAELLAAPKPPAPFGATEGGPPAPPPGGSGNGLVTTDGGHLVATPDEHGRLRWTIPLEVTAALRVGAGVHAEPVLGRPGPTSPGPAPGTGTEPGQATSEAAARALTALAEARERPYYDEDADEEAAGAYYAGVDADLDDLFEPLSGLVRGTHVSPVRYDKARLEHLYPVVDLRPAGDLRSVYSGEGFEPEEMIREDLAIREARQTRLQELVAAEGLLDDDALEALHVALEASLPFNCEHVVPQSWFGRIEPMKGDLHHLFTCESRCNSFRSNIPYFEFGPEDEVIREECGRREQLRFEPDNGKGAVARATLYFLLRYPRHVGDEAIELQRERIGVLLDWHNAEPVSLWEKHRNAEIQRVQGNRNPLIDHPEWADRIGFAAGFGG